MATFMYAGRKYQIHHGPKGGAYISRGGRKIYIKGCKKGKNCGRSCIKRRRKCTKGRKRRALHRR